MERKIKNNYYINRAFALNFFITPIYVYYLKCYGLSYTEIAFLHIIRDIVIFSCEIPFGIVSDWMGRKVMIYLSGALAIGSLIVFATLPVFSFFGLAFALWGGAIAADSGTVSALIYEVLENKAEHKQLVSNSEVIRKLTHSIINFLGSILYMIHIKLPFIASIGLMIIPLVTGRRLPNSHTSKIPKKLYFSKIKETFKNKIVLLQIISLSLMTSAFSLTFMYQQPRLESVGIDVKYFGAIFGVLLMVGAIGSYYLRYFDLKKSVFKSLMFLNLWMAVCIYLMVCNERVAITLGAMVGLALLNGLIYPLKFVVINDLIDDDVRSGVLSSQSYIEFSTKSVISVGIGVIADVGSLEVAVKVIASIPLLLGIVFFVQYKQEKGNQ